MTILGPPPAVSCSAARRAAFRFPGTRYYIRKSLCMERDVQVWLAMTNEGPAAIVIPPDPHFLCQRSLLFWTLSLDAGPGRLPNFHMGVGLAHLTAPSLRSACFWLWICEKIL